MMTKVFENAVFILLVMSHETDKSIYLPSLRLE